MPTRNRADGGFEFVTQELFDEKLEEILDEQTGSTLLAIPGLYEVVSEHFNNQVLDELKRELKREHEESKG